MEVLGCETKGEIEENAECQKELYYDFTPFNSKDPVLLSLMTAKKYDWASQLIWAILT